MTEPATPKVGGSSRDLAHFQRMTMEELHADMLEFGWQWCNQHGFKVYQQSNKIARRPDHRPDLESYPDSDSSDSDPETPRRTAAAKNYAILPSYLEPYLITGWLTVDKPDQRIERITVVHGAVETIRQELRCTWP